MSPISHLNGALIGATLTSGGSLTDKIMPNREANGTLSIDDVVTDNNKTLMFDLTKK